MLGLGTGWIETTLQEIQAKLNDMAKQEGDINADVDDLQKRVKDLQASAAIMNTKLDTILAAVAPGPAAGFSVTEK